MSDNSIIQRGQLCPDCGRYYDRHVVVDGLIVDKNKILLELRNHEPDKGIWALVGGFVDWNETSEQAILREVKEEIGIAVEIIKLLDVYSDPERDHGLQNVAIAYLLKPLNTDFILKEDEVKEVKWFNFNNLPDNVAFDHRKMIEDYIRIYTKDNNPNKSE